MQRVPLRCGLSAYKSKMRDALEAWLMSMMFGLLALTLYIGKEASAGGEGDANRQSNNLNPFSSQPPVCVRLKMLCFAFKKLC
jgi:hypothetical protein